MMRCALVLSIAQFIVQAQHLQWATKLPGAAQITASEVDSDGNTWVGGSTSDTELPVTSNALQPKLRGDYCNLRWQLFTCPDGFLAKFDAAGKLLFATYLGRSGPDSVKDLAVGPDGSVYALGCHRPVDAPQVNGECLTKLNGDGSLAWSVELGAGTGFAQKLAVDARGSVFVAGDTDETAQDPPYGAAPVRSTFYRQLAGGGWEPVAGTPRFRALAADVLDARRLIGRDTEGRYWRSADAGATWTAQGSGGSPLIDAPLSLRGNTVYSGGQFRSEDGGATFLEVASVPEMLGVIFDPVRPDTLYGWTYTGDVLRSTDDGRTWTVILAGTARLLAVTPTGRLYAFSRSGDPASSISDDAGQTWRGNPDGAQSVSMLAAGPGGRLYADGEEGLEFSDAGAAWTEILRLPAQRPNALAAGASAAYAVFLPNAEDVWIMKLGSGGASLWAMRFGGNGADRLTDLALDGWGDPVIGGSTASADLPAVAAAAGSRHGWQDGFIARFSAADGGVLQATYAGTPVTDIVTAVESAGDSVFAALWTDLAKPAAEQDIEASILRYSSSDAQPATLLRIPGSSIEDLSAAAQGDLWFAATTLAEGLASTDAFQTRAPGQHDVLLGRVSPDGTLAWSTYYGGPGADLRPTIAVGPGDAVSVAMASQFAPLSHPAFTTGTNVVARFGTAPLAAPALPENAVVNAGSFRPATEPGGAVAPGAIVAIFGEGLARGIAHAESLPLPGTLLDTRVSINGRPAPLFYVSPQQVNAQVPWDTESGTARIQVRRGSEVTTERTVEVVAAAPGLWTVLVDPERGPIWYEHAKAGQRLLLYATGLGALEQPLADGAAAAGPIATATLVTADIDGAPVTVEYAGAAPGFVGLYQVNIRLPDTPVNGSLVIAAGGVRSNQLRIWSQP